MIGIGRGVDDDRLAPGKARSHDEILGARVTGQVAVDAGATQILGTHDVTAGRCALDRGAHAGKTTVVIIGIALADRATADFVDRDRPEATQERPHEQQRSAHAAGHLGRDLGAVDARRVDHRRPRGDVEVDLGPQLPQDLECQQDVLYGRDPVQDGLALRGQQRRRDHRQCGVLRPLDFGLALQRAGSLDVENFFSSHGMGSLSAQDRAGGALLCVGHVVWEEVSPMYGRC